MGWDAHIEKKFVDELKKKIKDELKDDIDKLKKRVKDLEDEVKRHHP